MPNIKMIDFWQLLPEVQEDMAKNYAFSVNMVFSHERMCHGKETLIKKEISSRIIYFNKNFERDVFNLHESFYNRNEGETGRIFETFIAEQILIKIMKDNFCFGELMPLKSKPKRVNIII